MTWIYLFPAWAVGITAMILLAAIAAAMVIVVRRFVPASSLRDNDVAGSIATVVGTILAVLLSFMLVADWQEYDQAAQTASNEAGAAEDLYQTANLLPEPTRGVLDKLIAQYAQTVVEQEWPLMRSGDESALARQLSGEITNAVVRFQPKTQAQSALQSTAITLAATLQNSRRDRLFDNQQGIPMILWGGIALLVVVTLVMCALFSVRNVVMHVVMSASVGVVVAVLVVLTAEVDYPFRGDIQLPPTAWDHVSIGTVKD